MGHPWANEVQRHDLQELYPHKALLGRVKGGRIEEMKEFEENLTF